MRSVKSPKLSVLHLASEYVMVDYIRIQVSNNGN